MSSPPRSPQRARRPVSWRIKLAALVLSTSFALLLCELALRLLPADFVKDRSLLEGDALLGIPPTQLDPKRDFPEPQKPADVYRIVVLGDSQTVSGAIDTTYPEVLERLLNAGRDAARKRVEVHNAGAPGHSQYQYYLALDRRLRGYQPDLVIVGTYLGNDLLDLIRDDDRPCLAFERGRWVHEPPVFYKFYDPKDTGRGLVEASRVLQLGRTMFRKAVGYKVDRTRIMLELGLQGGDGFVASTKFLFAIVKGSRVYEPIFRQSLNQILFLKRFPRQQATIDRIASELARRMKALSVQHGFELLYAPIPSRLQIQPDLQVVDRTLAATGLDRTALKIEDGLYASFRAMLDRHGLAHVDLTPALKAATKSAALYEQTDHLTVAGNAAVAQALFPTIEPRLSRAR